MKNGARKKIEKKKLENKNDRKKNNYLLQHFSHSIQQGKYCSLLDN